MASTRRLDDKDGRCRNGGTALDRRPTRGDPAALAALQAACRDGTHRAVRSGAIGEDSGAASFAGTHLSVLGVCGFAAVVEAIRQVQASGWGPAARAYQARLGLDEPTSRMAVVVQGHRSNRAGDRSQLALGEAVGSGLVTPDRYRLTQTGTLLQRSLGDKDLRIRRSACGGTQQAPVAPELIRAPCLSDAELATLHALAAACDRVFGSSDHNIEFEFWGGAVFLLQQRPITGG
jgi:pyruvate,water dikinase